MRLIWIKCWKQNRIWKTNMAYMEMMKNKKKLVQKYIQINTLHYNTRIKQTRTWFRRLITSISSVVPYMKIPFSPFGYHCFLQLWLICVVCVFIEIPCLLFSYVVRLNMDNEWLLNRMISHLLKNTALRTMNYINNDLGICELLKWL